MLKTLIAEDNADFRESLREVLARRFPTMVIDEAADGEEALLSGQGHHHDLIFMDINMPGKNGLDVTRILKESDNDAVVCLITNYDLQEYRDAAEDCGADHFIVKDDLTESLIFGLVTSIFED
jgi:DNA-binding NarL/FixJ family response regulator